MNEELLLRLIEQIASLTPELWRILIRQVYVDALSEVVLGIVAAALFSFGAIEIKKRNIKCDTDRLFGTLLFVVVPGASAVFLFVDVCKRFLNPEFYAIQWMLNQF